MEVLLEFVRTHWGGGGGGVDSEGKCNHLECQAVGAENACGDCHQALYCGSECQSRDWSKVHQYTCIGQGVKRTFPDEDPEKKDDRPHKTQAVVSEFPLKSLGRDLLGLLSRFMNGYDMQALRSVSREVEMKTRMAFFARFRFNLIDNDEFDTPEFQGIIPFISSVSDLEGIRAEQVYTRQHEAGTIYLRDVELLVGALEEISWDHLREIKTTKHLRIQSNTDDIHDGFPPNPFSGLIQIETLCLDGCNATEIPSGLEDLPKLWSFKMRHGGFIPGMYSAIRKLSTLRHLDLSDSGISVFPEELLLLSNLEVLIIQSNRITALPDLIGNLAALQTLNLADNWLTTLPHTIGRLSRLKHLDVTQNRITILPRELGSLSALKSLYLVRNALSVLPAEIGKLYNLRYLSLENNPIGSLPAEIGNLSSLETLNLSNTRISKFPAEIGRLSTLKLLVLAISMDMTIPNSVLKGLPLVSIQIC